MAETTTFLLLLGALVAGTGCAQLLGVEDWESRDAGSAGTGTTATVGGGGGGGASASVTGSGGASTGAAGGTGGTADPCDAQGPFALKDPFNATMSEKWDVTAPAGTTVVEKNDELVMTLAMSAAGVKAQKVSKESFDMYDCQVVVHVVAPPVIAGVYAYLLVADTNGKGVRIEQSGPSIQFKYDSRMGPMSVDSFTADISTVWWRIRSSNHQIVWETSKDGKLWQQSTVIADSQVVDLSKIHIHLAAGIDSVPLATAQEVKFDDLNLPPP